MILIGIPIILTVLALAGIIFARIVIYPKCFGYLETYEIEKNSGKLIEEEYQSWPKEEILLPSQFGYSIHGLYFPIEGSKRTIILSHGITYTLFGSVKYMPIFRNLGFNVLIYDLRRHGKSGGTYCTFGYYEKYDLMMLVSWVKEKTGADTVIGTHGESMGAVVSMLHAAIDPRVDFMVSDCGFTDLREQVAYRLKVEYRLGKFPLLYLASFFSKILSGMSFDQAAPIQVIDRVQIPVLFIHGAEDDYIPPQMALDLYEKKNKGARKLYLAPHSRHAESFWDHREEYTSIVTEFLRENKFVS